MYACLKQYMYINVYTGILVGMLKSFNVSHLLYSVDMFNLHPVCTLSGSD